MSQPIHLLSDLSTFGAIAAASLTAAGMVNAARLNVTSDAVIGTSLAVAGPVTGTSFSGSGSSLTALNASNLGSGTVPQARLGISGTRDANSFLRGDGAWATAVTAVSVANANGISASVAGQGIAPVLTFTLGDITPNSVVTTQDVIAQGGVTAIAGFTGPGTNIAGLNASNLASGTVALARLGTGTPDGTKFLSGTNAWATAVTAVTIVTANGVSGSIANQGVQPAITLTLGAITPSSVAATGNVGGATLSSSGLATLASLSVTGAATVGTTLGVTGAATALSLTTTGASTAQTLTSTGKATIGGTLGVTGATSLSTLNTSGLASLNSISVTGTSSLQSLTVATTVDVTGNLTAAGVTSLNSMSAVSAAVTGNMTVGGTLGVTGVISGVGSGLTALNATNLSAGTVPVARLGSTGTRDTTTFLRGDNSWTTALTGLSVVAANGVSASITNGATTPALTFTLGAITPSSVNTTGSVTAASFVGGTGSFSTLSTSGLATLNSLTVTGATSLNTVSSSGLATLQSLSTTNDASVGGALTVTGTATAPVFIPTQTTVPTTGVYAAASGGVAIATNTLERIEVTQAGQINISGPVTNAINAVAASAVDCSKGNYFTKTYNGALTWTFINVPTGVFYEFTLRLIRGASGTQTWPSTVKWTGGTTPTLTNTNGGSDIMRFMTDDGGASWRAYRLTTTTT